MPCQRPSSSASIWHASCLITDAIIHEPNADKPPQVREPIVMTLYTRKSHSGFTLVEIAIVLVIIGLLLGGILKGQELINSARVRNLADMNSGVQAAYYGFIDRYRAVPGDMNSTNATAAIGFTITSGGNQNGRIDSTPSDPWQEPIALWEQLSKAGFIQGNYQGGSSEPTTTSNTTPLNVYNAAVLLGRTVDYQGPKPRRLGLVMGRNMPVKIMRELDVKIDDGLPLSGVMRLAATTATVFAGTNNWGATGSSDSGGTDCSVVSGSDTIYDIAADAQDCNAVFLY